MQQGTTPDSINAATTTLEKLADSFLNMRTLGVLLFCILTAILVGRFVTYLLRKAVRRTGFRADVENNPIKAAKLRRTETMLVLSMALIRAALLVFALYFAWLWLHPNQQPTAIIGASALIIVLVSTTLGPILRDISAGTVMMAEQWYGVGDHISIEPFANTAGVVERVTLRSTRLRGLNGETIWLNNQHIQGIKVAPRGVRRIAIDVFVSDVRAGRKLMNQISKQLPQEKMMVTSPLKVIATEKMTSSLWRVTAIGEVPPGREWLLEDFAIKMLKEADNNQEHQIIIHGPLARHADPQAEARFARAVRKS